MTPKKKKAEEVPVELEVDPVEVLEEDVGDPGEEQDQSQVPASDEETDVPSISGTADLVRIAEDRLKRAAREYEDALAQQRHLTREKDPDACLLISGAGTWAWYYKGAGESGFSTKIEARDAAQDYLHDNRIETHFEVRL